MKFETTPKIDEWAKKHSEKCKTRAFDGAQFAYTFIPTGIVEAITVRCMCCKKKFTDYVD